MSDDALNSSSSDDLATNTPIPDAAAAPSSGAGPDTAAASPAETPATEREGLLAAVKSAVEPKDPAGAADKSEGNAPAADSDPAAKAADPDADPDPTDADLAAQKPQTRKWIGKLTRQRNEAREALQAIQPELTAHRELRGYLDQHQLAADDVNLLLGVGAALRRGDFKAFLDGIEPYREIARQSLGLAIAPDLRTQVDDGAMTEAAAAELTRTRLEASRARVEADTQTQRIADRDTRDARAGSMSAVDTWEQGIKARDPDYALKEAMVRRTSQALMTEQGAPRTPQDAVKLVQRAYDEVTATFARARPAPQATRPTPSGVSTPSLGAAAEPRSLMEAAKLGLARMQRA